MILVSSYPKSGATWFQFLIYSCYRGKFASSRQVLRFYPPINRTELIKKSVHDPLFIKAHASYSKQLSYFDEIKHCILLVRNPLDVALSLVNHHINQGSLRLLLPYYKRKFLDNYLQENEAQTTGSWIQHSKSWLEQSKFPVQIISYEDLIAQPFETITKLRDSLELAFDDEKIHIAIEHCSIKNMKALEQKEVSGKIAGLFYSKRRNLTKRLLNSNFVNKGGSSNYRETFSSDYLQKASTIFNPQINKLDLKEIPKTENI